MALDGFSALDMPALHMSLSRMHLDYIMLMCLMCESLQSRYQDIR